MKIHKRITPTQMKAWILEDYLPFLPGWSLVRPDVVGRVVDPIFQGLAFERPSSGSYRVSGYIDVLCAEGCEIEWYDLSEYVCAKSGGILVVDPLAHEREKVNILKGIKTQIRPGVDQPLVPERVLDLYEELAIPTPPDAHSLASLNAFLGHDRRALKWCRRYRDLSSPDESQWAECDVRRLRFLEDLEQWIRQGIARAKLEEVLREVKKQNRLTE